MDLKQLKALVTIAETENMTKAAEILNIVQPAISRQIRLLEEDLGAVLFERGRQGMILNDEGKTFVEYARRILNEIEKAKAEIRPSAGTLGGIVNIGLLPSTSDLLSSMLVSNLQKNFPGIKVRISTGYAGHMQNWLENGEIDIALLYASRPSPAMRVQPLVEEGLWFVGPPGSQLQANQALEVKDILDKPLILPSPPHGIRNLVNQACQAKNLQLDVIVETNSMSVQKKLVLDGLGFTILPSISIVDDVTKGVLEAAPLADLELSRTIVLALSSARNTTSSVRCVVNELVQCIKKSIKNGNWSAAKWIAD